MGRLSSRQKGRMLKKRLNSAPKLLEVMKIGMKIWVNNWMRFLINVSSVKALEPSFQIFTRLFYECRKLVTIEKHVYAICD